MPERDDDGFLLRWSRRKRQSARGRPAPDIEPPAAGDAAQDELQNATGPASQSQTSQSQSSQSQGQALDSGPSITPPPADPAAPQPAGNSGQGDEARQVPPELADIDIDALDYDSDYTRFLGEGVPEALRRRALRRLWRSNPILANVDGLNDYDDDFTDAALVVDVLKTVHKVGKGYLEDDDEDGVDDTEIEEELDVAGDDDERQRRAAATEVEIGAANDDDAPAGEHCDNDTDREPPATS